MSRRMRTKLHTVNVEQNFWSWYFEFSSKRCITSYTVFKRKYFRLMLNSKKYISILLIYFQCKIITCTKSSQFMIFLKSKANVNKRTLTSRHISSWKNWFTFVTLYVLNNMYCIVLKTTKWMIENFISSQVLF